MFLDTKRLYLRNFTIDDIDDAFEYLSNPNVMYFIESCYSYQQTFEFIIRNSDKPEPSTFALVERITNKVIGHIIFHCYGYDQVYELGWILGENYQKKGYAYEISCRLIDYAFKTLNLHKIVAQTIEGNDASIKLMKKLGMTQEALFRLHNLDHGKWVDEYWFGLLHTEYKYK